MNLNDAWNRLGRVDALIFEAKSQSAENTGWNGRGQGSVGVEQVDSTTLLFHEKGSWIPRGGKEISFTNLFRWTADLQGSSLRLEHLRFGEEHPVYLFDLAQSHNEIWRSIDPHLCRNNCYAAIMECRQDVVRVLWTIRGPSMDESIEYFYT